MENEEKVKVCVPCKSVLKFNPIFLKLANTPSLGRLFMSWSIHTSSYVENITILICKVCSCTPKNGLKNNVITILNYVHIFIFKDYNYSEWIDFVTFAARNSLPNQIPVGVIYHSCVYSNYFRIFLFLLLLVQWAAEA